MKILKKIFVLALLLSLVVITKRFWDKNKNKFKRVLECFDEQDGEALGI